MFVLGAFFLCAVAIAVFSWYEPPATRPGMPHLDDWINEDLDQRPGW